jgi:hypothetical protein
MAEVKGIIHLKNLFLALHKQESAGQTWAMYCDAQCST